MTSDLPGDLGPADPGLERLFATLASDATPDELAGERQALAMFRANIRPPAAGAGQPAVAQPTRVLRQPRAPRFRLRLAAVATAVALVGGFAGAAYAAALPAPVQHIAYQAFHVLGVPDSHHGKAVAGHQHGSARHSGGRRGASPGPSSHSAAPGRSSSPSPRPSSGHRHRNTPSPSPSAPGTVTGASLTATAAANQIPAGSSATIDGQLNHHGKPLAGVTVQLWARSLAHPKWEVVGHGTSSAHGSVAISVVLTTDSRLRLTDPDGQPSAAVTVTVVPQVTVSIKYGSGGVKDFLRVVTQYARPGDTVVLEGNQNGTWVAIRNQVLNANGRTTFVLRARRYNGVEVRVRLAATGWHAEAFGGPLTVGPPA